jgi:hypothetical protein
MPDNTGAIAFLTQKITALQVIQQALTSLYTQTTDLDLSDTIRSKLTRVNEDLFALESERSALTDASQVVSPPSQAQIQQLNETLTQLDAYVHSDQNIHMAINYLDQLADQIKNA